MAPYPSYVYCTVGFRSEGLIKPELPTLVICKPTNGFSIATYFKIHRGSVGTDERRKKERILDILLFHFLYMFNSFISRNFIVCNEKEIIVQP